jgi:hypothetical protein
MPINQNSSLSKKANVEKRVQKELKDALHQIDEKLYDTELKAKGVSAITKVALVFYGKQVWMEIKS